MSMFEFTLFLALFEDNKAVFFTILENILQITASSRTFIENTAWEAHLENF